MKLGFATYAGKSLGIHDKKRIVKSTLPYNAKVSAGRLQGRYLLRPRPLIGLLQVTLDTVHDRRHILKKA